MNTVVPGAESPVREPRRKKVASWALGGLGILVIVLAILLLGTKRPRSVPDFPDGEECRCIAVISAKLWSARQASEPATVELTPAEVNALLNLAIRAWQLSHGGSDDPVPGAVWRASAAHVTVSLPLTGNLALNVGCRAVPHLENGRLTIVTSHDYAGWLPLPAVLVDALIGEALKRVEAQPYCQAALEVLREIRVLESGDLAVTFDPRRAGYLLALLRSR